MTDTIDRDTDARSVARSLQTALTEQQAVTRRMNDILSNWRNPGPPNAPQLLTDISAEAQGTITAAQAIQRLIGSR